MTETSKRIFCQGDSPTVVTGLPITLANKWWVNDHDMGGQGTRLTLIIRCGMMYACFHQWNQIVEGPGLKNVMEKKFTPGDNLMRYRNEFSDLRGCLTDISTELGAWSRNEFCIAARPD